MHLPLLAISLVVLLVGGRVDAQPRQVSGAPGVRHLDLMEDAASRVHEVGISPGITTAFRFHGASIDREKVVLEGRERLWVTITEDAIVLVPSEKVVSEERLKLTVPFNDGAPPGSAVFMLVVHPAAAERQLEVYRQRRSAESIGAELKQKDAQLQQCRDQVELLQAELKNPEGLTGLLAASQLDAMGVATRNLLKTITRLPGIPMNVQNITSFRSAGRVAVSLRLESPEAAAPWVVEGVVLRSTTGGELKGLTVWQGTSEAFPMRLHVVVEAEATDKEARGPFTLKLWDASRQRSLALGNVTFP
jgi:uncharacterized protein (TIGR02268 family)